MFYDFLGAAISLLATYYFIKQHSRAWTVSMLATLLNAWLYWEKSIFADMGLETFYFITALYGWYHWHHSKSPKHHCRIHQTLSKKQWSGLIFSTISIYLLILYLLKTYTHSDIVNLDALSAALSLSAQWLMCHKVMATWVVWFTVDILYAVIYWQKSLPFHTLLMFVYTFAAIIGYFVWRRASSLKSRSLI